MFKIGSLLAAFVLMGLQSIAIDKDSIPSKSKLLKVSAPIVDTTLLHKASEHVGDTLVFEDYEDPSARKKVPMSNKTEEDAFNTSQVPQEEINGDDWIIFPNPSNGDFSVHIEFFDPFTKAIIRDIEGRVVHIIHNSITEISSFAQGIYWVEINHKDFREIRKVIVN